MSNVLDTINEHLPYEDQFEIIRKANWGDENPQVELFCGLLPSINSLTPSMIEVGSGGVHSSFYSILFEKFFKRKCKLINIEPRKHLIDEIAVLWKNKHLQDTIFYHGYVGTPMHIDGNVLFDSSNLSRIKIQDVLTQNDMSCVDILHADIQGSEMSLCDELQKENLFGKFRYIFISSHFKGGSTESTHHYCKDMISKNMNCRFHFDDVARGGCGDGLLVVENIDYSSKA